MRMHGTAILVSVLLLSMQFAHASQRNPLGIPPPWVWPLPAEISWGDGLITVSPDFAITSTGSNSSTLSQAFSRTISQIKQINKVHLIQAYPAPKPLPSSTGTLKQLTVTVDKTGGALSLNVDESYHLSISANGNASLNARTDWGAMHGLKTLVQLIQYVGPTEGRIIQRTPIDIHDQPRFPWRGFLFDSARHFFSVNSIKKMIDALASVKFNVFHWHIVDAQSFPVLLQSRPRLAQYGAYSHKATYSAQEIHDIVTYAALRGIEVRVVPEMDTPGHSFSWGNGYPEIIVNCTDVIGGPRHIVPNINNALFDMTQDITYEVVSDVITEFATLFSDEYFHYGGDEVVFSCMDQFPRIKEWMQKHLHSTDYYDLIRYYTKNLMTFSSKANKKMVFWQEAFVNNGPDFLPKDAVVQVWIKGGRTEIINNVIESGRHVLVSSGWYLDQQIPSVNDTTHYGWIDTWQDFYLNEPTDGLKAGIDTSLILGGTACQWAEQVDGSAIWGRVFPRAAAAVERLWSPKEVTDLSQAQARLVNLTCRLGQLGFGSSPIVPDYCEGADE